MILKDRTNWFCVPCVVLTQILVARWITWAQALEVHQQCLQYDSGWLDRKLSTRVVHFICQTNIHNAVAKCFLISSVERRRKIQRHTYCYIILVNRLRYAILYFKKCSFSRIKLLSAYWCSSLKLFGVKWSSMWDLNTLS